MIIRNKEEMQELLQYTLESIREDINIVKSFFGLRDTGYAASRPKPLFGTILNTFATINMHYA